MSKDTEITATEASRGFSELLHRVRYGGESFVIKKGRQPMARLVPVGEAPPEPKPAAADDMTLAMIDYMRDATDR